MNPNAASFPSRPSLVVDAPEFTPIGSMVGQMNSVMDENVVLEYDNNTLYAADPYQQQQQQQEGYIDYSMPNSNYGT